MTSKTIVLVGASGGIGRVLSREFVAQGHKVVLVGRDKEKLTELQKQLGDERTFIVSADASDPSEAERIFKESADRFGEIDVVVMSAGTWQRLGTNESVSEALEMAHRHHQSIFLPTFVVGYTAQKFFREQGRGLIINISSHAALKPELKGNLTYGPYKAASHHYILALREELKGTHVRVADLAPAIVNTDGLDPKFKTLAIQPENIAKWILDHLNDSEIPATTVFDTDLVLD